MDLEQMLEKIKIIKQENPDNLMARHFDERYYRSLTDNERQQLSEIVFSGVHLPDSKMGAYAMSPGDYERFSPLFDPMIKSFHGIPDTESITASYDWNTKSREYKLCKIDAGLHSNSMRVRVARNVESFPLPGGMSKSERVEFENVAIEAFEMLSQDTQFGGQYYSITPGSPLEISKEEYQRRVSAHQMFKDMSSDPYLNASGISGNWPFGRGMYISKNEDFLVWVGEEDHLRIMAMRCGSNLNTLFERLNSGLRKLGRLFPSFSQSKTYGNITSCPTNLGTGMRASLHIKLPNMTNYGTDLSKLKTKAYELGLEVRGVGGEHSSAGVDGLVDISPSARLGVTEVEIMKKLYHGIEILWSMERSNIPN